MNRTVAKAALIETALGEYSLNIIHKNLINCSYSCNQKCNLSKISKVTLLFDIYSSSIGIEQGFNCDSPEGGTIKKKPALNKSAVKQNDDTTDNNKVAKQPKGVRFKDSFTTGTVTHPI